MSVINLNAADAIYFGDRPVDRVYLGTRRVWPPPFVPITATGGTITDIDVGGQPYRVHTFTASGDFVVSDLGNSGGVVEYLVVGGGGSGGLLNGATVACGGGGGGEVRAGVTTVSETVLPVVVGSGGASVHQTGNGLDGTPSSFAGIEAGFGGGGGRHGLAGNPATNGGGGGGASQDGDNPAGGIGSLHSGGRGYGAVTSADRASGGGGGAGGPGGDGAAGHNGGGGAGVVSSITGSPVEYGRGAPGTRGSTAADIVHGDAGTGNGGTGTGAGSIGSGSGGSGIVIIRYPLEEA